MGQVEDSLFRSNDGCGYYVIGQLYARRVNIDPLEAVRRVYRKAVAAAQTTACQQMRQTVTVHVQFAEGEGAVPSLQRRGIALVRQRKPRLSSDVQFSCAVQLCTSPFYS